MGIFSGLKRGGDKKKKAAKYHAEQPGVAEKDILNQAFLGDDPYLRAGNGPAKLFPGNEGIRPLDYQPTSPGSDIDSIYSGPPLGSGHVSNHGSRHHSPAILQPPQFPGSANSSVLDLPSRPWSSGTGNGNGPHQRTGSLGAGRGASSNMIDGDDMLSMRPPRFAGQGDDRPSTSHGPGSKAYANSPPSFASRFGPAHRRTDTQGLPSPGSRPGSQAASRIGTQSPLSPTHSPRHMELQSSIADKKLSTSSDSPTKNSDTSPHSSATATTASDGQRAASPPSTVSSHSRTPSSADNVWPAAGDVASANEEDSTAPTTKSSTLFKESRARDAAKKKELAIAVPRRRSWSAQINQLEKAWLEEHLNPKYQQPQEKEPVPSNLQPDAVQQSQVVAAADANQSQPMPPKTMPPREPGQQKQLHRQSPQNPAQQKQDVARQSPRTAQGPSSNGRGHMNSQSAQQFPLRRGPPPNGHPYDGSFDPRFDPRNPMRNDLRYDPRFDPRNDSRAGPRQGPGPGPDPRPRPQQQPPQQMAHPPSSAPRGRVVDYNFMPSSIDQYGGVGGGPYAMGLTSRAPLPGVQMADIPMSAPRSATGGMPRPHRRIPSDVDIDISTPIDVGGRMPETRLPAVLRGSKSMQQLPRVRNARGPMPMSPPSAPAPFHSRAGSAASQMSQGPHFNRGYPHPPPPSGMRSASAQGMRSPQYPVPLPAVGMREGGSRYPMSGPGPMSPSQGPGPGLGPRRVAHSSSADLTVYRDQHHQYGSLRSPMSGPGYGPGPRPSPDLVGHAPQHSHQQFGPSLDRRSQDSRPDTRSDPRFLNLSSPTSPGSYDRQLADVAEDIEEKSVLDMPGVAVKDFASKEEVEEEAGQSAIAASSVEPLEQVPQPTEPETEAPVVDGPAAETEEPAEEPAEEPIAPKAVVIEPTPSVAKSVPRLSFGEPTRGPSPESPFASTQTTGSSSPTLPGSSSLPLTPVTPTADKLPLYAANNYLAFSHAVDSRTRSTPEQLPETTQAIAERRRTRFSSQDDPTPPDTPVVDAPAAVLDFSKHASNASNASNAGNVSNENEEVNSIDAVEEEEEDGECDLSTDATTLSNEDASRPQTPVALAKAVPALADTEAAKEAETREMETAAHTAEKADGETVDAEPINADSAGGDIVETVVAVQPRSGSGATNYSSPPLSPISLPAGDAEPSANANWPLPSLNVLPASRSPSPGSASLAEAIAGPIPTVPFIPVSMAADEVAETVDDNGASDCTSDDKRGIEHDAGDDLLMGSPSPSPTRKTAFTASIYAKDIGIGPYAFDDAPFSLDGMPYEPLAQGGETNAQAYDDAIQGGGGVVETAPNLRRPTTPTLNLAPADRANASPGSIYSRAGEELAGKELTAAASPRQGADVGEQNDKVEVAEAAEATEAAGTDRNAKRETGLMNPAPEAIGLARGPSILGDMDPLAPRGKRRWNFGRRTDKEPKQERPAEVAGPAVRGDEFVSAVPGLHAATSTVSPALSAAYPTRKVKTGPPPPLTGPPQFDRHVPTNVVDRFGTTFI